MGLDQMLNDPVCPVFDADAGQVPHKSSLAAIRAVVGFNDFVAGIAKIVGDRKGGLFESGRGFPDCVS